MTEKPVDDDVREQLPAVSAATEVTRFSSTAAHAAFGVGRFLATTANDLIHGKAPTKKNVAHEVRVTFEHLGPTYVKLGQLIASSPGVFTPALSEEFESLLDRVRPASAEDVHRIIAEEFGQGADEVFATFDDEPIASASIAQVHTATLRTGEEVVVKIQRPGIADRL
ncbi:AarF/UbiB family protein, partial [Gordonia sp. (in: high G+C Gram-positive bacteria)]